MRKICLLAVTMTLAAPALAETPVQNRIDFQTEVESLTWDDGAHRWTVVTQRGDRIRAQFFISAGGLMHKAKLPGIASTQTLLVMSPRFDRR